MLFVLAAIVVIGGLVALVVLALARFSARAVLLVLAGAIALLMVVAAGRIVLGLGGSDDHNGPETPTPALTPTTTTAARSVASTPVEPGPPLVEVAVPAVDPDKLAPYLVIDGLAPDTVVRVRAAGFESFEPGRVEQCVTGLGRLPGCTGASPVQFSEGGAAEFQYLLRASFALGACRAGGPTCTLRITGYESGREGAIQTVFVDEVEPGRVSVKPARGILDGQRVTVHVAGYPAGADLIATLCAAPGGYDPRRCQAGPATAAIRVGSDGSGATTLAITTGDVGLDRLPCDPRHACGVTVVSQDGFVASPTAAVGFSLGPGAEYDRTRLVIGLSVTALLLLGAFALIGRTNWDRPTEAATPEMDATDLETEHTLDDLFGTDEEIDAKDPVAF